MKAESSNSQRLSATSLHRLSAVPLLAAVLAVVSVAGPGWAAPEKEVAYELGDAKKTYQVLVPPDVESAGALAAVLYLHPAGEPNFEAVKRDYWPMFRYRKCLMVMPRSSGVKAWGLATRPAAAPRRTRRAAGEEAFVMDALADAQKRYNIDPKRIILMGVSGGGQVALFLADRFPDRFRAVIAISTAPTVIRGEEATWFYPNRETLKTCPYFAANHITRGAALMYWRQVQVRLAPQGASISILPVLGPVGHYFGPPKELGDWLDEVLAGKQPAPLGDPQKEAVAKMYAPVAAALPKAIEAAKPAEIDKQVIKNGRTYKLIVPRLPDFVRSDKEDWADWTGAPLTQIQIEHKDQPVYVRYDACLTARPMDEVLAAEEAQTIARGMLYQVYHADQVAAGGRTWKMKIGSFTYPDQKRGWVSPLFIHASAPIAGDPTRWLTVLIWDETQRPEDAEIVDRLAILFKTAISGITVKPPDRTTSRAGEPASAPAAPAAPAKAPAPAPAAPAAAPATQPAGK